MAFRSVESLLESVDELEKRQPGSSWTHLVTDYFVENWYYSWEQGICKPATTGDLESDRNAVRELRKELEGAAVSNDWRLYHYTHNIMGVTPAADVGDILPFLDHEDDYVVSRACDVIGTHRYEPAIKKLGQVADGPKINAKTSAIDALGRIGAPAAIDVILNSFPNFPKGLDWLFAMALRRCGCVTRDEEDLETGERKHLVRIPGEESWRKLGEIRRVERAPNKTIPVATFGDWSDSLPRLSFTKPAIEYLQSLLQAPPSSLMRPQLFVRVTYHMDSTDSAGDRNCTIDDVVRDGDVAVDFPVFQLIMDAETFRFVNRVKFGIEFDFVTQGETESAVILYHSIHGGV
ncbi:HEAT repeat domain-containing protein [Symmachiella macrocystis]|uniref:HEAT repeat domain-containing protein n=1 Tax=Symmachiella macrocystis TaxID=2527985 RepID=UPI0018D3FEF8|nr:HEAT repeat domain-containing protein [Symmachiella macrocystis]